MKRNSDGLFVMESRNNNLCCPKRRRDTEPITKSGLSYTPSQMMAMAEQGIPVSMGNAENFNDGVENPEWFVPYDRLRGVDPADLWNVEQDVKGKMRTGYRGFVKAQKAKQQEPNI